MRSSDPITFKDGYWWFWNEVWSELIGPFNSEEEAIEACKKYAETL